MSRPDRYIQENTALNPNKRLAQPDVSQGKMLLQEVTEDSTKMTVFPLGPSKHSLYRYLDLFSVRATDFDAIVIEGGTLRIVLRSAPPCSSLWAEPVSTIPRLPPRTKEERVSMLGDRAEETIGSLNAEKYKDALRKLDSLNDSLRDVILSRAFPGDISEILNNTLDSLESCKQVIYDGIKEENAAETIQQHGLIPIIEGFGKVLKAYANLDEWEERMAAEWGGNRR